MGAELNVHGTRSRRDRPLDSMDLREDVSEGRLAPLDFLAVIPVELDVATDENHRRFAHVALSRILHSFPPEVW
jgi:hypothetical protein